MLEVIDIYDIEYINKSGTKSFGRVFGGIDCVVEFLKENAVEATKIDKAKEV